MVSGRLSVHKALDISSHWVCIARWLFILSMMLVQFALTPAMERKHAVQTLGKAREGIAMISMPISGHCCGSKKKTPTLSKARKETSPEVKSIPISNHGIERDSKKILLTTYKHKTGPPTVSGDKMRIPPGYETPVLVKRNVKTNPAFYPIILQASSRYQVDPNLVRAIIMAESGYNPNAVSKKGAKGLMQLMPKTAQHLGVADSFNPEHNIDGGVRYFKQLLDRFDGDTSLALAAYNAGSRYVRQYQGVPPFKETQYYIKKVLLYYQSYRMQTPVNEAGA
jgi:hypothetical protein